ncbi:MAG: hypothetical protein WAR79_00140 [Melioribacteraceae bacterium]
MFNKNISFIIFFCIFTLSNNLTFGQEIGKIFALDEANANFGKVLESKSVSSSILKEWLNSTSDKVMFKLEKDNLVVLGDQRDLLFSNLNYNESNEIFHMYSKSKVIELLTMGGSTQTYFENRENVFSISNGEFTLELSFPCPPSCP